MIECYLQTISEFEYKNVELKRKLSVRAKELS